MKIIKILLKIIFWLAVIFTGISFYSLIIAQNINIEFADWHLMQKYYDAIFGWLPLTVLLTLCGTIKKENSKLKNIIIAITTITASIFSFFILVGSMFSIGFGAWINTTTLYGNRKNPQITIKEQRFDEGALGYGGTRIVKLKPFMKYWYIVNTIDTTTLNKNGWILLNRDEEQY